MNSKSINKQNKNKIPEFKTVEEEAEFWDTHDFTDYWDETKPARVLVAKNLSEGVTVRFDPNTLTAIRSQAQTKGIGPTTLIRMWVKERLTQDNNN